MVSLPVLDKTGAEVGAFEVDPRAIAPRINKQLLHDAVVMYQSNLRMGTSKTKSRGEVAGSTKKMYRQKGTGNARAGSRRSGIRRGGGHIFAKRPHDWTYRLNKKALRLATGMAIASRILDEQVTVIDELSFEIPKTKEMAAILSAVRCDRVRLLVATETYDPNVYKSARNIEGVHVSPISDLNAYRVLAPQRLLITKSALTALANHRTGAVKTSSEAK